MSMIEERSIGCVYRYTSQSEENELDALVQWEHAVKEFMAENKNYELVDDSIEIFPPVFKDGTFRYYGHARILIPIGEKE